MNIKKKLHGIYCTSTVFFVSSWTSEGNGGMGNKGLVGQGIGGMGGGGTRVWRDGDSTILYLHLFVRPFLTFLYSSANE